jgi:hypothetical protein
LSQDRPFNDRPQPAKGGICRTLGPLT